jgi:hypothetical protein
VARKQSSKVATDVNENRIRELALSIGLVDIKVCAVDEIWSGLKLVISGKGQEMMNCYKAHPIFFLNILLKRYLWLYHFISKIQ